MAAPYWFLSYFHSPEQSEFAPKNRVFNYLEKDLSLYRFDGANLTAAEALANKTGNCVTLAVLVAALAKEAGVDVAYRTSYSEPTLGFRDDIALSANHVQSYLLQPKRHPSDKLSDRDALVIDYYKDPLDRMGEMFDSERFFAVVYNNLAADALLAKDFSKAFWLSKKALQYDANYSPSINLIAVIYRQQGDLASAEQWFEYETWRVKRGQPKFKKWLAVVGKKTTVLFCFVISAMHGYFYLNNWI